MATFCCKYRVGPPPVVFAWGGGMGSGHRHPARWAAAHPHGPRRRRGPGRGAPTHERFVDDVLDALPRGGSWRLKRGCDRRLVRRPSPPAGHRLTWWRPPPGRFPPDPYPSGILDRRSWAILWPVAFPKPPPDRPETASPAVSGGPRTSTQVGNLLPRTAPWGGIRAYRQSTRPASAPSCPASSCSRSEKVEGEAAAQAMHRRWRGEDTIHPRPPSPDRGGGFER